MCISNLRGTSIGEQPASSLLKEANDLRVMPPTQLLWNVIGIFRSISNKTLSHGCFNFSRINDKMLLSHLSICTRSQTESYNLQRFYSSAFTCGWNVGTFTCVKGLEQKLFSSVVIFVCGKSIKDGIFKRPNLACRTVSPYDLLCYRLWINWVSGKIILLCFCVFHIHKSSLIKSTSSLSLVQN